GRQLEGLRVTEFEIPDRTGRLLNPCCHAGIALTADVGVWQLERFADGELLFPFLADGAQVIGKSERRATAFGADNNRDLQVRQAEEWVQLSDGRVIPLRNLAEKDVDVHLAREAEFIGRAGKALHARNVVT